MRRIERSDWKKDVQRPAQPTLPITLDIVTILPRPSSSMPGRSRRIAWKCERTLTLKVLLTFVSLKDISRESTDLLFCL